LLLPFFLPAARTRLAAATADDLAPGTTLHVTLLGPAAPSAAARRGPREAARLPARLLCTLQCRQALAQARRTLRDLNEGGGPSWKVGWWLDQAQGVSRQMPTPC
jgi:hypothetical protein